jgi:outer membrane protein TolC
MDTQLSHPAAGSSARPRYLAGTLAVAAFWLSGAVAAAAVGSSDAPEHPSTRVVSAPVGAPQGTEQRPVASVIDDYVREALASNLSLRAESLVVERSLAALDAARARFFPTLAFDARYTRAEGGRTLDLPLGTLLNPVSSTLNQLLAAQGRPAEFGSIQNQSVLFQREREQDTRLSMRQALWAPAIPAAMRAQRAQLEAAQFDRMAVGRRLKRDVTVGYLDWLKATRTVGIVESSVALLNENLRVSDSLYRNGKVTQDQVLRARAELLAVEQQLRDARNGESLARSYENFLLNRPLDTALEPAGIDADIGRAGHDLGLLRAAALSSRPEIAQLDRTISAAESQIRVVRAEGRPTLSLGVDAGTNDERYDFGSGRNFGTISLLLHWQFFDGGATTAAVHGARAEAHRAAVLRDETSQQIQLEVQQALDRLETSTDSLATADARAAAAHAAFRIAARKRDEGVINQVEFIDARSSLTSAELNLNLTRFEVLARQAELDYATAAGTLPLETISGAP